MHLCDALLILFLFPLYNGLNPTCPRKCNCDSTRAVECYRIIEIPRELPSTIRRIYISHSKIKQLQISDFSRMSGLEELILACSGTESVEINTFKSLDKLKTLELWKNKIKHIPTSLPPSLEVLKLGDNSLSILLDSDFDGLKNLRVLDVQNNMILALSFSILYSLCNLQSLTLDGNNMESVSGSLKLFKLKYMSMENNKLHSFSANLFAPLQNLQLLNLNGNFLTKVPLDLPKSLLSLKLERNQLKMIRFQDLLLWFYNETCAQLVLFLLRLPDTLTRLDLKGNNIQEVGEQELKNLKQLQVLNLRNNNISALNCSVLEFLPRLRYLYLDGNPWNCTCDLLGTRRVLMAKGTEVKGGLCSVPAESQGESWMSSKKFLQLCEDHLQSAEKGKEIGKKMNTDDFSSLRANVDDYYYDYEID
uniref:Uncharacterized protein n=1 Tax=Sphenodon punctatus TaxID=8508 RepID=A0A8D0GZW9_SPHPU